MGKYIRLLTILSLLVAIFLPVYAQAGNTIYLYEPYPQGTIGITTPEIGWKIQLQGNEIEKASFYLNGNPISVNYDAKRETFYYKPSKPLTGVNSVYAKIKLKNWSNMIEESWTFTISNNSLNSLPKPNLNQNTAINFANDYRYLLDLPLYEFDYSLNYSAQKHSEYQKNLNVFSHFQTSGTQGFFGETVKDRANYYGFYGATAEDISYQSSPSIQEAVDSLFAAPYHRIPFLIPSFSYYGYGSSGYYHVLNFGSQIEEAAQWVAYPIDNQMDVPIAWENYETPNPLRFYTNAPKKVGYPIVAGIYGENVTDVTLKSAKLFDKDGLEVPVYLNSPKATGGNDEELDSETFIIPMQPLNLNSTYKVNVILEAKVDNIVTTYDKTWYFITEQKENAGNDVLHQNVEYPPFSVNNNEIQFVLGQRFMSIDNNYFSLDVSPFIESGRTMVPFRALGNSLGASVEWNSTDRTITYQNNGLVIVLPINENSAIINGKKITLDQGAIIRDGRSFVPSRFVSEQLNAYVQWVPQKQEVIIKK